MTVTNPPSPNMICVTDQAVGEARITSSLRVAERSGKTRKEIGVNAADRNSADPTMIKIPLTRSELTSMALSLIPSAALELWPRLTASARLECRHRTELLEHAKHVNQRPVLNDLPGRVESVDVDQLERGLFAGRGEACELAIMGSGASHPARGLSRSAI